MAKKVRRIYDAKTFTWLLGQDDIMAYANPHGEDFDPAEYIKDKDIWLLHVHGCYMLFEKQAKRRFEGHLLLPKAARGPSSIKNCKKMLAYVFTHGKASCIYGIVPSEHMRARVFTRALGFLPHGPCRDAIGRDCVQYVMEGRQWDCLSG